jgi:hypothetical protein
MNRKTEHDEQVAVIDWYRKQYPTLKYCLFAIPNGGLRHIRVAMTLKKEGVLSGVSDMFLMVPRGTFHGLFIEMKTAKGKVSDNQQKFLDIARSQGYEAIVCYGFEDAKNKIKKYFSIV